MLCIENSQVMGDEFISQFDWEISEKASEFQAFLLASLFLQKTTEISKAKEYLDDR